MNMIKINVYDKNGEISRTCVAKTVDLQFGTIRRLMEVLNLEDITNTGELLKTVYGAWEKVTEVLSEAFPDIKQEEWDQVKLKELIPAIVSILKYSFSEILTIPKDPKN